MFSRATGASSHGLLLTPYLFAFDVRFYLQRCSATTQSVAFFSLSVAAAIRSSPSSFNGPVRVHSSDLKHVLPCFVRRSTTMYASPVVMSYGYQPTTSERFQSIETVHRIAIDARTREYCVPGTIWRTRTRRFLTIAPEGNGNKTPRPLSTIYGSKSGISSNCTLYHGHAQSKNFMMTMTT